MRSDEPRLVTQKPYEATQSVSVEKISHRAKPVRWLVTVGAVVVAGLWFVLLTEFDSVEDEADSPPDTETAIAEPVVDLPPIERSRDSATNDKASADTADDQTEQDSGPSTPSADARQDALDSLQDLREQKEKLDAMSPKVWASEELANLEARAETGDAAYANEDFVAANKFFLEALALTEELIEHGPKVARQQKQIGKLALQEGNLEAARDAYEMALAINPNDRETKAALHSVSVRKELDALLLRGSHAAKTGNFSDAKDYYAQARDLDPADNRASAALASLAETQRKQQLKDHIEAGYDAIAEGKNYEAMKSFDAALKMEPFNQEAVDGKLLATRNADSAKLARLRTEAKNAEIVEDWALAVDKYEAALAVKSSISFAREGLARTQAYLGYKQELDRFLDKPERLSSQAVRASAESYLRGLPDDSELPAGLSARKELLGKQLDMMSARVPVTILSDGKSEVIIQRMGRLGAFKENTITMGYGTHILTARRKGYVDKRVTLDIPVNSGPISISVVCDEQI